MSTETSPPPTQIEVLESLQSFVGENLLLTPIDKAWQPTDYLPDLTTEDFAANIQTFRTPALNLTDEILVVLVADMITEEALPSYSIALNLLARDYTGTSPTPWAQWLRGWTSEENRHGDLLNAYLRLTGRVDMRAIEVTIHHLLNSGFNPGAYPDLYAGLVYTAFQERATKISHANVGKIADQQGDANLSKICAKIAGDESRHEAFYTRMMGRVFELDPEGAITTFRAMMRKIIAMPGKLMFDGKDPDLFDHFASVAQRIGVYTIRDYASITEHLLKTWKIGTLSLSGNAARFQDYLCSLPAAYEKHAEKASAQLATHTPVPFSWIHDRKV